MCQTDRRVFILERDERFDVTDAERYGRPVEIFLNGERKPPIWSNSFLDEISDRMEIHDFKPERDYVVVVGQMVPVVLWLTHLVSMYDTVNLLLFDASQSEYVHKAVI